MVSADNRHAYANDYQDQQVFTRENVWQNGAGFADMRQDRSG